MLDRTPTGFFFCAILLVLCPLTACTNSIENLACPDSVPKNLYESSFSFLGKKVDFPLTKGEISHSEDLKFIKDWADRHEVNQVADSSALEPGYLLIGSLPVRVSHTPDNVSTLAREQKDASEKGAGAFEATKQREEPFHSKKPKANRKKKKGRKTGDTTNVARLLEIKSDIESKLSNGESETDFFDQNEFPSQSSKFKPAFYASVKPADHVDGYNNDGDIATKQSKKMVSTPPTESKILGIQRDPEHKSDAGFDLMTPVLAKDIAGEFGGEGKKVVGVPSETHQNDQNHPDSVILFTDPGISDPEKSEHGADLNRRSCAQVRSALYELVSSFRMKRVSTTVMGMVIENLQLENQQDYLGVAELGEQEFETLQILHDYHDVDFQAILGILFDQQNENEVFRRGFTFYIQYIQKDVPFSWKIEKNRLLAQKSARAVQLDWLEKELLLNEEYPNPVLYPENLHGKILNQRLGISGKNVKSILLKTMGKQEIERRYGDPELSSHSSLKELPSKLLEEIRTAEKSNAVDIWKIHHMIKYLGLGKKKDFVNCKEDEVRESFEEVQKLIFGKGKYFFVWYHSPSRGWLIKKFQEEYFHNLESLCIQASKYRLPWYKRNGGNKGRSKSNKNKMVPMNVGDRLLFEEMSVEVGILPPIKSLKYSEKYQDWNDVFDQPDYNAMTDDLDLKQKTFLKRWLVNNLD